MSSIWEGATILITGGTGSLGSAFLRHALDTLKVKTIRVISRDEYKQAEMAATLTTKEQRRVRFLLGDVRDLQRLRRSFEGVDIVVHAAALKRIDAIAYDPAESVKTNVLGALNVVDAAIDAGVSRVIGISTDKSAAPHNLYGATKLVMERHFARAGVYAGGKSRETRFACVRYGNVLGSRGSILGIWSNQRAAGRPLQIAQEVTRFWLTLPQACEIIQYAGETMTGGEVFVPALPHGDLATLALAAFPGASQEWCGLRVGGEKAHETLVTSHEQAFALRLKHERFKGWVLHPEHPPRPGESAYWLDVRSSDLPHITVEGCRELLRSAGLLQDAQEGHGEHAGQGEGKGGSDGHVDHDTVRAAG